MNEYPTTVSDLIIAASVAAGLVAYLLIVLGGYFAVMSMAVKRKNTLAGRRRQTRRAFTASMLFFTAAVLTIVFTQSRFEVMIYGGQFGIFGFYALVGSLKLEKLINAAEAPPAADEPAVPAQPAPGSFSMPIDVV